MIEVNAARAQYRFFHRWHRLLRRLEAARGRQMNLTWLDETGTLMDMYEAFVAHGWGDSERLDASYADWKSRCL